MLDHTQEATQQLDWYLRHEFRVVTDSDIATTRTVGTIENQRRQMPDIEEQPVKLQQTELLSNIKRARSGWLAIEGDLDARVAKLKDNKYSGMCLVMHDETWKDTGRETGRETERQRSW